ncbi:hypothetical protein GFS03_05750 [Sulfolobus sp. E5-1-F]|uniref:hypothetical protein n=1 Tax=Sulfolobaceae TaxID=118883 RepID=UPI0012960068|nr:MULTISPECIES: hypothetical protein [unclassified Sulfolobus]QGA54108.1 hypothetical protein GFS03_05750 [Sulfolobus sp. E5-1-F]QGA69168.1 hypothetical protein GFS33_11050 [Sulfolobus sp. E11-6]
MISLKISHKKDDKKNDNWSSIPITYDMSRLPEEYLRNEFPEEWRSLQKEKKYYGWIWYS